MNVNIVFTCDLESVACLLQLHDNIVIRKANSVIVVELPAEVAFKGAEYVCDFINMTKTKSTA